MRDTRLDGRDDFAATLRASAPGEVEDSLRRLYEHSPAMLHCLDMAGNILAASDLWLSTFGYGREEVLGRRITDFLTPLSYEYSENVVLPAFLERGHCEDIEYRMARKDGVLLDVLISARLERQAGDEPRIFAAIQDITRRGSQEEALRQSEAFLQRVGKLAGTGGWEIDLAANAVTWAEETYYLLRAPLDYRPTLDQALNLHPPEARAQIGAALERAAADGQPFDLEVEIVRLDGVRIWSRVMGEVESRGGEPVRITGAFKDITRRVEERNALLLAHDRLAIATESGGIGIWEWDIQTDRVVCDERMYRLQGMEPQERTASLDFWKNRIHPEDRGAVEQALLDAIEDRAPFNIGYRVLWDDGSLHYLRASARLARDASGRPLRMIGANWDVPDVVAQSLALQAANERVALATDSGRIGIWEWDLVKDILICDSWMFRLYGLPPSPDGRWSYAAWRERVHPDDLGRMEIVLRDSTENGTPYDAEFRIFWDDGSLHWIRGSGKVARDRTGRIARFAGTNRDVTPRKLAEADNRRLNAELAEQHELLRVTLQSIGDGVITADRDGNVAWLNPVAERMTGWRNNDAIGRPMEQVFHIVNEETREPAASPVAACLAHRSVGGLPEYTLLVSRDGTEFGIEDSVAPIENERGDLLGAVLVFHDVTEQRRLSGEMTHRATHDALTGLINRSEFEARLRRLLQSAQADSSENALLYLDLDQFKVVNDTCGHAIGDQLLLQVARLLAATVRASDTVARLGGDEFAILLHRCPPDQAQLLAQRICDRMDDFRFAHEDRAFRIGVSVGLVPVDDRWANAPAIVQAGDSACYAAKEAGRNRVHAWSDSEQAMRERQGETQWAVRLENAIDCGSFALFAQRLQSLDGASGGIHAEVLVRLATPDGPLVPPGAFLPAAERFHLISRIDRWVLGHVCLWMAAQPCLNRIDCLNVNLSGQSVSDRAFHRWAIEALANAGPRICQKLCIEITETAAVTNLADAALFIEQLRALGVKVALDDFGAGASSFGYLKKMPVDVLKIDGQFIRDLVDDPLADATVRCFADVARVVKVKTVAEFVENDTTLERLRDIGIDFAQGYLIHKPAPIDQLLDSAVAA